MAVLGRDLVDAARGGPPGAHDARGGGHGQLSDSPLYLIKYTLASPGISLPPHASPLWFAHYPSLLQIAAFMVDVLSCFVRVLKYVTAL